MGNLRVEYNTSYTNGCRRYVISPKFEYQINGGDLKGDKTGFIEKEVPSSRKPSSIVDPSSSHADEGTRNRHVRHHLSKRVVHHANHDGKDSISNKKTAGAALGETTTDAHEERGADTTSDGNQLDLTIAQMTKKLVLGRSLDQSLTVFAARGITTLLVSFHTFVDDAFGLIVCCRHIESTRANSAERAECWRWCRKFVESAVASISL